MPLLTATGLSKSYGPDDIFSNLNFSIPERARIGLVGANGVGKTTLLRLLVGQEEPSQGHVRVSRGVRLGYLPQRPNLSTHRSIWQECLSAFSELIEMQEQVAGLERQLAVQPDDATLLESYGKLQMAFELRGGYTYETRIRQTLAGLGFAQADYQRPLDQASGGQRTRAFLSRLLLSDPDLLLLDEPTNHLDIEAIEWLEGYLRDWPGATLIVSHDRYFLDQVVQDVWEMTPALETYNGNYSAYLGQREVRYRQRMEEYEAQQAFIEKEDEYIRRNLAGQNSSQAKGRRTRLARLLETAVTAPLHAPRSLALQLSASIRSGDLVLRTYDLQVGYPASSRGFQDESRVLFQVPDLVLRRGECAAVIGPNGAGKTTFLKTVLGQIPPLGGSTQLGASLEIGYFAQAHEGLDEKHTLMEEIEATAPHMRQSEIRDYLARFLFSGDDVFKTVGLLSGGERGRLALAVLALSRANLLLLDEPTNHLDLPSQEVLQAVLADYPGTILLVSHDRYLIDHLATQVWEVLPERGELRIFEGAYSQYKEKLAAEAGREQVARSKKPEAGERGANSERRTAARSNNRERERLRRIEQLEREIAAREAELARVGKALENPPADAGEVQRLGEEYLRLQQEIDSTLAEWGRLQEEI